MPLVDLTWNDPYLFFVCLFDLVQCWACAVLPQRPGGITVIQSFYLMVSSGKNNAPFSCKKGNRSSYQSTRVPFIDTKVVWAGKWRISNCSLNSFLSNLLTFLLNASVLLMRRVRGGRVFQKVVSIIVPLIITGGHVT